MLKHLPEKALKKIQKHLLYSKKSATYPANSGRRIYNSNDADGITDDNIDDRTENFQISFSQKLSTGYVLDKYATLKKLTSLLILT